MLMGEAEVGPGESRLTPCIDSVDAPKPGSGLDAYKMLTIFLEDEFFHEILRGIRITSRDYGPPNPSNQTATEILNRKLQISG